MNVPVLFLLGAVALALLGGMIVWISSRPRKERFGESIDAFSRDLGALRPPPPPGPAQQRTKPGPRPTDSSPGRR